jgi:peptide/nickel transport system permease protein
VAHSQYVEAAQLFGASTTWVLRRHVWAKVLPSIAVTTASVTGASLVIVSSLTFLGIGVVPPQPTWGGLLATNLENLFQQPWGPFVPGLVIVGTVWALNAVADALRDATGTTGGRLLASRNTTRKEGADVREAIVS